MRMTFNRARNAAGSGTSKVRTAPKPPRRYFRASVWWALPLVLGAGAAQLALWRGAGSVGYRRGSRSLVRGLVPQNATRIVAGIAVGLGLFMLVGSFLQQGDISWFPLTGGIDDPLARYAPSVQR